MGVVVGGILGCIGEGGRERIGQQTEADRHRERGEEQLKIQTLAYTGLSAGLKAWALYCT